ncbi:MAG: hypothetical protein AAFV98_07995 [Chloroflexota bacterium]
MADKNILTAEQRDKIADKLMLLGNIVFSGMIIAPLVSQPLRVGDGLIAVGGGVVFGAMYISAIKIMKGGDRPA